MAIDEDCNEYSELYQIIEEYLLDEEVIDDFARAVHNAIMKIPLEYLIIGLIRDYSLKRIVKCFNKYIPEHSGTEFQRVGNDVRLKITGDDYVDPKDFVDPHLGCDSWPNCDLAPGGCEHCFKD